MQSSRLPGKVLMNLGSWQVLDLLTKRLARCRSVDEIVIATSNEPCDDPIADFCNTKSLSYFRGESQDVLSRFYDSALRFKASHVLRITADCPLIDPNLIDDLWHMLISNRLEYAALFTGAAAQKFGGPCFPDGLDCEWLTFDVLEKVAGLSLEGPFREHVTLSIWGNPQNYTIDFLKPSNDFSDCYLTLDTPEDHIFLDKLVSGFESEILNVGFGSLIQEARAMKRSEYRKNNYGVLYE